MEYPIPALPTFNTQLNVTELCVKFEFVIANDVAAAKGVTAVTELETICDVMPIDPFLALTVIT
jgi:hypothetical protein